jgi:flagellar protein FliS
MQVELESSASVGLEARIDAAAPQEVVAMLLEGASGFTDRVVLAIAQRDQPGKARMVNKVSAIIEHLVTMLNYEEGGALVDNLSRIYEFWLRELLDASAQDSAARLQRIAIQMGTLKESWH